MVFSIGESILTILGLVLCFLPFILNHTSTSDNENISSGLQNALFGNFFLTLPLLTDFLLYFFSSSFAPPVSFGFKYILFGLLTSDLLLLYWPEPTSLNVICGCLLCSRIFLVVIIFLKSLKLCNSTIWNSISVTFLSIFVLIGMVLYSLSLSLSVSSLFGLRLASLIFLLVSFILFVTKVRRWLIHILMSTTTTEKESYTDRISCNLLLLCLNLYLISTWFINLFYNSLGWMNNWDALMTTYLHMESGLIILIILFHYHIVLIELDQSQNALRAKGHFVRHISHEVRSPLTTVFLGLELLEKECLKLHPSDQELLMDLLIDIKKSCDISLNTINEMLTYDKIEEGLMKLDKIWIYALQYIKATISPFIIQAKHSEISIDMIVPHECKPYLGNVRIHADPHKLGQVIRNLVSNALKFSPHGSRVVVRVAAYRVQDSEDELAYQNSRRRSTLSNIINGNAAAAAAAVVAIDVAPTVSEVNKQEKFAIRIDVIDSGPGISKENQQKLFKEVIQFNPGKLQNGGGSGLGLWISHGIVQMHEGKLAVFSDGEGCGSTFTLELPATIAQDDRNISPASETRSPRPLSEHHNSDSGYKSIGEKIESDKEPEKTVLTRSQSWRERLVQYMGPIRSRASSSVVIEEDELTDRTQLDQIALKTVRNKHGASNPQIVVTKETGWSEHQAGKEKWSSPRSNQGSVKGAGSPKERSGRRRTMLTSDINTLTNYDLDGTMKNYHKENLESLSQKSFEVPQALLNDHMEEKADEDDDERQNFESGRLDGSFMDEDSVHSGMSQKSSKSSLIASVRSSLSSRNSVLGIRLGTSKWSRDATSQANSRATSQANSRASSRSKTGGSVSASSIRSYSVSPNRDRQPKKQSKQESGATVSRQRSNSTGDGSKQPAQQTHVKRNSAPELPTMNTLSVHSSSGEEPLRLLVVDDTSLNRKMLCRLFRDRGDICTEAEDGLKALQRYREALEKLKTMDEPMYDAILMDFQMPNMDGPTATKELRTMGYKGVIIGVTGNGMENDIQIFMEHGCDKVILKPLTLAVFDRTMQEIMQ